MAQVCGDSSYDFLWDRQHVVALGLLRRAADTWASGGAGALSSDALIAVLLHVYLSEWPEYGGIIPETRKLEAWLQLVTTAHQEFSRLRPSSSPSVVNCLVDEVSFAANQWALGDSESPPTEHVINAVEHILFSAKLTRRPPNPKLPASLLQCDRSSSAGS